MKNKELGLPYSEDGMEKIAVCFDVDGTLIDGDTKLQSTIDLLKAFAKQNWKNVQIIIWSGGGADYARTMTQRHISPKLARHGKFHFYSKLEHELICKRYDKIIAFDDIQDTRLGDVNLIVRNK